MKKEIRQQLEELREPDYGTFSQKLVPGIRNVLGIRMPILRALASQIAKSEGVFALEGTDEYYEETLLRGLVIGKLRLPAEEWLDIIRDFVPRIDNWAVCDSFVSSLKPAARQRERIWDFLQPYVLSDQEFEQRFAAVMLLDYFVCEEWMDRTLCALLRIGTREYYASMGVAWALAECYIKFPEQTLPAILSQRPDPSTLQRLLRKVCDSYRVSPERKNALLEAFRT